MCFFPPEQKNAPMGRNTNQESQLLPSKFKGIVTLHGFVQCGVRF